MSLVTWKGYYIRQTHGEEKLSVIKRFQHNVQYSSKVREVMDFTELK